MLFLCSFLFSNRDFFILPLQSVIVWSRKSSRMISSGFNMSHLASIFIIILFFKGYPCFSRTPRCGTDPTLYRCTPFRSSFGKIRLQHRPEIQKIIASLDNKVKRKSTCVIPAGGCSRLSESTQSAGSPEILSQ